MHKKANYAIILYGDVMNAVIHRPYFLPWLGYFSKLVYADVFIVMDDVLFTKRHYIDRVNIINTQGKKMWLGLKTGENYNKRCDSILLPNTFSIEEIMKTLSYSYSKARFFKKYKNDINNILEDSFNYSRTLSKFDIKIVELLLDFLGLPIPKIYFGSQFEDIADSTERLINFCNKTNCSSIIMGSGGSVNIHDIDKLEKCNIEVLYQDFYGNHPVYYQTRRERIGFEKGLSIVDCIFNEGIEFTQNLLLDPRHTPYKLKERNIVI